MHLEDSKHGSTKKKTSERLVTLCLRVLSLVIISMIFFQDQHPSHDHSHRPSHRPNLGSQVSCLSWMFLLAMFYFSTVSFNILANNHLPSPKSAASSNPEEFTEENARYRDFDLMPEWNQVTFSVMNTVDVKWNG